MKTIRNILFALLAPILLLHWVEIFKVSSPVFASTAATITVGFLLYGVCLVLKNRQPEAHEKPDPDRALKSFVGYLFIGGSATLLSALWSFRSLFGENLIEILAALKQYASYSLPLILMSFVFAMAFLSRIMCNGDYNRTSVVSKVCSVGTLLCAVFFGLWPWIVIGEQDWSLGQLKGVAWLSLIAFALLFGVGPIAAGQYLGARSRSVA